MSRNLWWFTNPKSDFGPEGEGTRFVTGVADHFVTLVFFAMGAIIILVGTQALRLASDTDAQVMSESLLFGTVDNMLRGNDVTGAISVRSGPEGDVLVARRGDENEAYEVRLFLYQGQIMQETSLADAPIRADKAVPVSPSSRFSVSIEDGGVRIIADEGQTFFAMRSPMAAQPSSDDKTGGRSAK